MVNILAFLQAMTDGDKSFWGSILGAALGVLGALIVALVAVFVDRKSQKAGFQRAELRRYNSACIAAEAQLNQLIAASFKNDRLLNDCLQIQKPGGFMINVLRTVELDSKLTGELLNPQLANEWLNLCMQINIVNQLVEDFNRYYTSARDELYKIQLTKAQLDSSVVIDQHKTIQGFASGTLQAIQTARTELLHTLALLHLHGEKGSSKKTKFQTIEELKAYEFKKTAITKKSKQLSKKYTPEEAFTDLGTNLQPDD